MKSELFSQPMQNTASKIGLVALKKFVDRSFPRFASTYRLLRDQRLAGKWQFSRVPLGFEMLGAPGMAEGRLESGELTLFLDLLKQVEIFIDIGANCGVFTLAARHSGVQAIAVEPNSENVNALLLNLTKNKLTDVEVLPIALAGKIDVLPLFGGGQGASLTKGWGGIASNYSRLVPVNTVDNLFKNRFVEKRLLIKMDVEGNEYDVLSGASVLMERIPAPIWFIEHGFTENFSGQVNPHFRKLFHLFWQIGYRSVTADPTKRPVTEFDVDRWLANGKRDFGDLNYVFYR